MNSPIHATTVARAGSAGWRGVLLTGASGVGKSDMALRLIDAGWRLVSDDYTAIWTSCGALYATAPARIAGRIEARGLGIVEAACLPLCRVILIAGCLRSTPERLPEPAFEIVHGVRLPRLNLDIRPASAPAILSRAMDRL